MGIAINQVSITSTFSIMYAMANHYVMVDGTYSGYMHLHLYHTHTHYHTLRINSNLTSTSSIIVIIRHDVITAVAPF